MNYVLLYRVGVFTYWIKDNGKELLSVGLLNNATKFDSKKEAYAASEKLIEKWFFDRLEISEI